MGGFPMRPHELDEMKRLFAKEGSYAAVAEKMGRSASFVAYRLKNEEAAGRLEAYESRGTGETAPAISDHMAIASLVLESNLTKGQKLKALEAIL